jgi:hypothetical protein
MGIIFSIVENLVTSYLKARQEKNKYFLAFFYIGFTLTILAGIVLVLGQIYYPVKEHKAENTLALLVTFFLLFAGSILLVIPTLYYANLEKEKKEELVLEQEKKVAEKSERAKTCMGFSSYQT